MDTSMAWAVMDRMRETQHQHGVVLDTIQKRLDALAQRQNEVLAALQAQPAPSSSSPLPRWLSFSRPSVQAAAQWTVGLLTMVYILRGGDLLSAIRILAGLSG